VADSEDKGKFSADIGSDVIQAALRSVEKHTSSAEVEVEVEGDAASAAEIETLRAQLELSQAKGRELMEKIKDTHEKMLRAVADLENYKKRAAKEKEEVHKFGIEKLLKDFLPVLDNLDRALAHTQGTPDVVSLSRGLDMVRKQFEDTLQKHGVKAFTAVGQPFDPRLHEAMQQVATTEVPPQHVLSEVVRGFTLNERLIRPALVVVATAPPVEPPTES
jgi:molecular chaperone GrpE